MITEKQKMLLGDLYFAYDDELVAERHKAQILMFELNNMSPAATEVRKSVFIELLGHISSDFVVELPFRCDYGYNIHLGKNFYSNFNLTILDGAPVIIGDNVMFGPNVSLYTVGHPIDVKSRNKGYEYTRPITIGDNVWLGGNVVVNPGVTIGDNAVIGSGSVVVNDIPADVVAVGNPCQIIRHIVQ